MATSSPDAPKTPTKPPRKTGKDRPVETNGHYPTRGLPNQTDQFLEYMEKTVTTGEYKPRGVGKSKRTVHPTDSD